MRLFAAAVAITLLFAQAQNAFATQEGDTHSTRVISCAFGADTCTVTITDMKYVDGKWVIVGVRHFTVPKSPQQPPIKE